MGGEEFKILLEEIHNLRVEQNLGHRDLLEKVIGLEREVIVLKSKATIWGSLAGAVVFIFFEVWKLLKN